MILDHDECRLKPQHYTVTWYCITVLETRQQLVTENIERRIIRSMKYVMYVRRAES
jgi:hypothetical protein